MCSSASSTTSKQKEQRIPEKDHQSSFDTPDGSTKLTSPLLQHDQQHDFRASDSERIKNSRRCGSETWGLLLLLVTAILFSIMGVFLKLAGSTGIPSTQLVFFRVMFQGSIVVVSMCFWKTPIEEKEEEMNRGSDGNCSTRNTTKDMALIWYPYGATPEIRNIVLLRGAMGALGFIMFFYTIKALPLGDAVALLSLYPVVTVFAARVFLGEVLKPSHVFAAVISGVGVILIARPTFIFGFESGNDGTKNTAGGDPLGYLTAMLGCCFASSAFILVRKAGKMGAHTLQLLFAWTTFGVLFSIAFGSVLRDADGTKWIFPPPSARSWCYILAMCANGTVAHFIFNYAAQIAPSGIASVAKSSEAMWSYAWQILVFGVVPKLSTVAGVVLIASSVGVIAVQKVKDEKKENASKLTKKESDIKGVELKVNGSYGSMINQVEQATAP